MALRQQKPIKSTARSSFMESTQRQTVVGIFDDRYDAEKAIAALHQAGFTAEQIGFVRRDGEAVAGTTVIGDTHPANGAGVGAGAVIGGVLGAAAALFIPGVGPVLAGGILAPVVGAAVGALAGGLIGALTEMGVPEDEARYANEQFEAGRTIV